MKSKAVRYFALLLEGLELSTYLRGCSFRCTCNDAELTDKGLLCCFIGRHLVDFVHTGSWLL
jgi:hypothetical protein